MVKKKCIKCNCEKEQDQFYFVKRYNRFNGHCKECQKKYTDSWKERNRSKYLVGCKNYNESVKEAKKKRYAEDADYAEKVKNKNKKSASIRMKTDINFYRRKLSSILINQALKKNQKTGKIIDALGCSVPDLKNHLEAQFKDGMSWNNYGRFGWHIDHIIPLSKFNLVNEKEFIEANNYKNLQPLWWQDNLEKRNG